MTCKLCGAGDHPSDDCHVVSDPNSPEQLCKRLEEAERKIARLETELAAGVKRNQMTPREYARQAWPDWTTPPTLRQIEDAIRAAVEEEREAHFRTIAEIQSPDAIGPLFSAGFSAGVVAVLAALRARGAK